jgi:hypothetical protein
MGPHSMFKNVPKDPIDELKLEGKYSISFRKSLNIKIHIQATG